MKANSLSLRFFRSRKFRDFTVRHFHQLDFPETVQKVNSELHCEKKENFEWSQRAVSFWSSVCPKGFSKTKWAVGGRTISSLEELALRFEAYVHDPVIPRVSPNIWILEIKCFLLCLSLLEIIFPHPHFPVIVQERCLRCLAEHADNEKHRDEKEQGVQLPRSAT